MPDRYTYPGTEVLRNRFGISASLAAHELETRIAYQRIVDLSVRPIAGGFDLTHLQTMHQAIYGDIWDWAGQIRSVDTGTVHTGLAHCRPEFIQDQAGIVFGGIARDDFPHGWRTTGARSLRCIRSGTATLELNDCSFIN